MLRHRLARTGRGLDRLESFLSVLASLSVLAVMAIVVVDVVLRYLFNSPLSWSFDLISMYLMVVIFYLALSDALQHNHHIGVDLLYQVIPARLRRALQAICLALTVPLFLVIGWEAAKRTLEKLQSGDVVAGAIPWPTWPQSALVAIGCAAILLRLVFRVVAFAAAVIHPTPDVVGTPEPGIASGSEA